MTSLDNDTVAASGASAAIGAAVASGASVGVGAAAANCPLMINS